MQALPPEARKKFIEDLKVRKNVSISRYFYRTRPFNVLPIFQHIRVDGLSVDVLQCVFWHPSPVVGGYVFLQRCQVFFRFWRMGFFLLSIQQQQQQQVTSQAAGLVNSQTAASSSAVDLIQPNITIAKPQSSQNIGAVSVFCFDLLKSQYVFARF